MDEPEAAQIKEGKTQRILSMNKFLEIVPINREAAYKALKDDGWLRGARLKFGRKVMIDLDAALEAMRTK